jgi:hypothetical protein
MILPLISLGYIDGEREETFLQNVQTGPGAHPTKMSRLVLEHTQPAIEWVLLVPSIGNIRPRREAQNISI